MNRCITCGKIVTQSKARNLLDYDGHQYLVCCPLCETEFNRSPRHYVAVAHSVLGEFAVKAHSQVVAHSEVFTDRTKTPADCARMLRNLSEAYTDIERTYQELCRHFKQVSTSGGLKGLRTSLHEHREMMDSLQNKMSIHSGVCRFVLSIAETSSAGKADL